MQDGCFGDYGPTDEARLMNQLGNRQQTDTVCDVWGDCDQDKIPEPEENVVKQKINNL